MRLQGVEDFYPLSPLQQGLLFHTLSDPTSRMYFNQTVATLGGDLDVPAFQQAWQEVIDRHPVLRTFFVWEGVETPVQVVRQKAPMPFDVEDWRQFCPDDRKARLESLRHKDLERGFDLSQAPLMRAVLLQTADDSHDLFWSFHHILMDGWSMFHVLREVFGSYDALRTGQEFSPASRRPYRDYIAWLQRQSLPRAEKFWRRALQGFTAPTPLLHDASVDPSVDGQEDFEALVGHVSEETTAALQALSLKHRLTLNTILQGTWALLLSRYSGEEDVLFGAVVAGRPADLDGVEAMVGLFINSLPVRIRIPPRDSLLGWLQGLQAEQAELREYEYSPLVEIQGWSQVPRGNALFESIFLFENYHKDVPLEEMCRTLAIDDVRWFERLNYPICAIAIPGPQLVLRIIYQTQRFSTATIQRMLEHWRTLLDGVVADPNARPADLPLLTASERKQLVVAWNATKTSYPEELCIHELFAAQAERTPAATALVCGEEELTYAELDRRANQLAQHLRRRGVGPEVLVGVCLERSAELVVSLLAILKAGGAYLPLDPEYPTPRLSFMLEDGRADLVVTQERFVPRLRQSDSGPRILCLEESRDSIAAESESRPELNASAGNLAYVIYTSGSTGTPKGTAIEHRSLVTLLHWARDVYDDEERAGVLASTSVCFDLSTFELFVPLSWGGRVILAETALELASLRRREEVTLVNTVPSAMAELVRMEGVPSSVLTVNLAGEPLRADLVDQVYALGVRRVCDLYGPSEDTTYTTFADRVVRGPATIGRPVANTEIYLLDAHQEPVPLGVAGEIYIGGAGLARGYLKRAALTAERFVPDPFSGRRGSRLYRTGDLARYLPGGSLELLGRIDHQVKIRGFRIELGEIEVRLGHHPDILDNVVMAREDVPGDKRLVAYFACRREPSPGTGELRSFIGERLPEYLVPTVFVRLDALPRTPNGKVDRRALPAPEGRPELETAYAPPETDVERVVTGIWQEILGQEKVGVHDNFFDLGGHSLHLIRLHGRLKAELNEEIAIVDLFKFPTVSTLARHLAEDGSKDTPEPIDATEEIEAGKNRLLRLQQQRRQRES